MAQKFKKWLRIANHPKHLKECLVVRYCLTQMKDGVNPEVGWNLDPLEIPDSLANLDSGEDKLVHLSTKR